MPNVLVNIVLEKDIKVGDSFFVPYPKGKTSHFFTSVNHTISLEGGFYRSPNDFVVVLHKERIEIIWRGKNPIKKNTLVNLRLEEPGGEFYFDERTGVVIKNMVSSSVYMITLDAPMPANNKYYVKHTKVPTKGALNLVNDTPDTPRTVNIHSTEDDSNVMFKIFGEDYYDRKMIEEINAPNKTTNEGRKAFKKIHRIVALDACKGKISVGLGRALGLPVQLPHSAFVLKEIFNDEEVEEKGKIIPAETRPPSTVSWDKRGLYIPSPKLELDGDGVIRLLVSLPNPGSIGSPDYNGKN